MGPKKINKNKNFLTINIQRFLSRIKLQPKFVICVFKKKKTSSVFGKSRCILRIAEWQCVTTWLMIQKEFLVRLKRQNKFYMLEDHCENLKLIIKYPNLYLPPYYIHLMGIHLRNRYNGLQVFMPELCVYREVEIID